MSEQKTRVPRNKQAVQDFAIKYNGSIVDEIKGQAGIAGYVVELEGLKIHCYLINVWHNNKNAISMNTDQLQSAIDDNALILKLYHGREFVIHSINWDLWARQDNNYDKHPHFGTVEVFAKKDNFRILDLNKHKLIDYYPEGAD